MISPIKTNDLVVLDGAKFMVNQVQLTGDGAILEVYPVKAIPRIVHASEVKLADKDETVRRAKSVGLESFKSTDEHSSVNGVAVAPVTNDNIVQIAIPDDLSPSRKNEIAEALFKTFSESLKSK